VGGRVPDSLQGDISVIARNNGHVSRCRVAEDGIIAKEVDIDVRDCSREFRRIGEVDHCLDGQGVFGSIDDLEVSDGVVERWKPPESRSIPGSRAVRDGYCKRSLARDAREMIFGFRTHV
jgi:hypothetical protein